MRKLLYISLFYGIILTLLFVIHVTRIEAENIPVLSVQTFCFRMPSHTYVKCEFNTTRGIYIEGRNQLSCNCPNSTIDVVKSETLFSYQCNLIIAFMAIVFILIPTYLIIVYHFNPKIFDELESI